MIDGRPDGATTADGRVMGTYLHGLFAADGFRRAYLATLGVEAGAGNYAQGVDAALDAIAARLEQVLDVDGLLGSAASV
jgi:adenosylcobyric acid synthase